MSAPRVRFSVWVPAALAVAATLAYFMASGYLSMAWVSMVIDPVQVPRLSAVTVRPLGDNPESYLWHWHLLALASLGINGWWAWRRLRAGAEAAVAIGAPLACHATWLLFAFLLHVTGLLASLVCVAYVLE